MKNASLSRKIFTYYSVSGVIYICHTIGSFFILSKGEGNTKNGSVSGKGADSGGYWDAGCLLPEIYNYYCAATWNS